MEPLVIIGTGGHGRELLDILRACEAERPRYELVGFLDDAVPQGSQLGLQGVPILGGTQWLASANVAYLIGVGLPAVRRTIDGLATGWGRKAVTLVHPQATHGSPRSDAPGLVLAAGARVTTNVTTGRHVHINVNATVSHDCIVGDFVTIAPGAHVSGAVRVGRGVWIGIAASVNQQLIIGEDATIGAGASVIRDVPNGATAVGVPARLLPATKGAPPAALAPLRAR